MAAKHLSRCFRQGILRTPLLTLVALVVLWSVPMAAESDTLDSLRVKIDSINAILDQASRDFDFETMSQYYEDDVIVLPNGEPMLRGKQAFLENEKAAEEVGYKILNIETELVDLFHCDNFVHEVGTYAVTLKVPGVPFDITDVGKYLVIWRIYPDGALKIKLETWNNDHIER
ncbi:hypothetical protein GF420_04330 [candidate division GN15 bacterium]|nr:hypothetical protein [candidate division GN15 bacterium]